MKVLFSATLLLAVSWPTSGMAPATHLVLSNSPCLIQICPGNPQFPTTVAAGVPFRIFVAARDGAFARDVGFVGTVVFTSSDPLASLPASYTFVPSDEGGREFVAVLGTPGTQSITVRDSAGNLLPGTLVMTVTAPGAAPAIPTLSKGSLITLVLGLALAALFSLRLRL